MEQPQLRPQDAQGQDHHQPPGQLVPRPVKPWIKHAPTIVTVGMIVILGVYGPIAQPVHYNDTVAENISFGDLDGRLGPAGDDDGRDPAARPGLAFARPSRPAPQRR